MTRPEDIPQDVWDAVARLRDDIPHGGEWFTVTVEDVARAIMAEREACAQVCLDYPYEWKVVGERYASAIRKRTATLTQA